jgi:hypothetical protein
VKILNTSQGVLGRNTGFVVRRLICVQIRIEGLRNRMRDRLVLCNSQGDERGDVPGWVLVVLMTTGLVTAIWTIAAPRLTAILRNSLDSMNGIR